MTKSTAAAKPSLVHLSVEEENLAAIPFAVLERRVGKRVGKIEIRGTKILPNGTEMNVCWQVQGNPELGLPTEQDLDIFVALGVLTFHNNFAKTVRFTGREIAKILGIQSVHGKFYQRLKMAMDRFIPLRFRGIAETDRVEEVKWLNVFQEASFTLDRDAGRCIGSVTWTDKLIHSMNNGFFRVLDASRYMELDGITGKHLYRFLAVAFEKADFIVMDARKLAMEHLGIMNPPKYLSRLMQTLEPAFGQLIRIEVLGSYHVVESDKWEIALTRHKSYVPERKLLLSDVAPSPELNRVYCTKRLEKAGLSEKIAAKFCDTAALPFEFYRLERCARIIEEMVEEGVLPHVALSVLRKALAAGVNTDEGLRTLDACELAVETCRQKKASGQNITNAAGLIVKLIKDQAGARKFLSDDAIESARLAFAHREQTALTQVRLNEQRALLVEYERYREESARAIFQQLPEAARNNMRREKVDVLKQQARFDKLDHATREQELDELVCQDIARREIPPFERWYIRRRAGQAILPFDTHLERAALAEVS